MPLTVRQRSIHSKTTAKRATSIKGKKNRNGSEGDYLATSAPSDLRSISYPGGAMALGMLLTARLAAAFWVHIGDCDETYNYWEPLHYLIYGSGLQTWEYSPLYAVRSYTPLWILALPGHVLALLVSPPTVFYGLRVLLAVCSSCADLAFYKAVCHEFGVQVGRVWLFFTLPAAGSFACSAAMLPSAWSAALVSAALASWWRKRYRLAVMFVATTTFLSWPFTALLGLPIAIDMLAIKRQYVEFIRLCIVAFFVLLVPTVVLDSWQYGKIVIAPWNIIAYNIFTSHGPDLYGVEGWTYYFVNGFLNFNLVWVMAWSCPVFLLAVMAGGARGSRAGFCAPYWLELLPVALWMLIFLLQPHKEERFLYPVYSMVILCGAITLDCLQKLTFAVGTELFRWRRDKERRHYLSYTAPLMFMCITIAGMGGLSRIISLYNNYHGPLTILRTLPPLPTGGAGVEQFVCFGKEWYRSPSSFHLPNGPYSIRFVQSEFKGQLPAPYANTSDATRISHPYFNDMNQMDNRTLLRPEQCHYLVDSDVGSPTPLQPFYHLNTNTWDIIDTVKIIDAEKSHKIFRAFYVPLYSWRRTVFSNMYLLRNKVLPIYYNRL